MRELSIIAPLAGAMLLSACATYSFAPPKVDIYKVAEDGQGAGGHCSSKPTRASIDHSIEGANHLIDNFLLAYRCAERQVAEGRQTFEVPALLIGLGGAAAAAAGAPAGVALGTGATIAGLNGGKSYYAPKDKLPIMAASVDALVCIKNESVGLDAYGSSILNDAAKIDNGGVAPAAVLATPQARASVAVKSVTQYYRLIETALLAVENITVQRLGSIGDYSPDAILTEFQSKQKAADAAEAPAAKKETKAKAEQAAEGISPDGTTTATATDGTNSAEVRVKSTDKSRLSVNGVIDLSEAMKFPSAQTPGNIVTADAVNTPQVKVQTAGEQTATEKKEAVTETLVYISQIQPKLQLCVLRAKL